MLQPHIRFLIYTYFTIWSDFWECHGASCFIIIYVSCRMLTRIQWNIYKGLNNILLLIRIWKTNVLMYLVLLWIQPFLLWNIFILMRNTCNRTEFVLFIYWLVFLYDFVQNFWCRVDQCYTSPVAREVFILSSLTKMILRFNLWETELLLPK